MYRREVNLRTRSLPPTWSGDNRMDSARTTNRRGKNRISAGCRLCLLSSTDS